MKHLSLFSGGCDGFSVAAEWMGWTNVAHVEIDKWNQKLLKQNFPESKVYGDIREFNNNITRDVFGNVWYIDGDGNTNIMGQPRSKKYDNAIELYESGLSIADCAEFYGITRQAMHKILTRRGCKMRDNLKYGEDNHFYRGSPENRKKRRAQNLVEKAIKRGSLINPGKCENCGCDDQPFSDGRSGIQAHHDDYNKPLKVRWLCQPCHHNWHKENKALNATEKHEREPSGAIDIVSGGFP